MKLLVMIVAALALAACGGSKKPAPARPSNPDDPVAEMVRLKDALCACEDMGCAQDVSKELEALGARFEGTKISDEQGEVASAAAGEIADCLTRLVGDSEDERHSPPTM